MNVKFGGKKAHEKQKGFRVENCSHTILDALLDREAPEPAGETPTVALSSLAPLRRVVIEVVRACDKSRLERCSGSDPKCECWIFFGGRSVPEADMMRSALISWEGWVAPSEAAGDVLAVQGGDRDAFASLLSRYQNRLYRYLLRWVHEPATAEDLFQQTWVRVIENIRRYDPKRNFDAWLFAVARNIAIDHLRRWRPGSLEVPLEDDLPLSERPSSDTPGALDHVLRAERVELVQKALASQPPVYREILSLRFEEEMKLEEIAEVLSIPLGSVKSRLSRALEHLRTVFLRMQLEDMTP